MKVFRLLSLLTLLAVCAESFAQFTNTSSSSSSSSPDTEGWSSFWVEWNPSKLEKRDFTGLSLGFSRSFSISKDTPLFVEGGMGIQYSFRSEDEVPFMLEHDDYYEMSGTEKIKMFSIKAPINILYNYSIPNSSIAICPFAGITLRYNLSAKYKYQSDFYDDDDEDEINLFDEEDMDDDAWKRFQIGWQIGAKVMFNKSFTLGVSYGTDFSEIWEKTKIKTTSVALGLCF